MQRPVILFMLCLSAGLSACGGGSKSGGAMTPHVDPFVAFVQRLAQTQPDDSEPEDVTDVMANGADDVEPLAL